VYVPRLIVPLSAGVSNLATFAIQLALFAGFFMADKFGADAKQFHLEPSALLLPLVVAQVGLFSLGVGLWLAALTAKFRDFGILAGFAIQLWLYATPVIYPLSQVPDRWRWLAELNPMAMPVELSRHMLLGIPAPAFGPVAESLTLTLATVAAGIFIFRRAEKNFVDVI
jgi:lipopolysaccharide transport system permease protein